MTEEQNSLLDMKLRDILDKYCVVFNPECCYYYGIFEYHDIEKLYKHYNIDEDYPEAFSVEELINHEILLDIDDVRGYDVLLRIMDNLGINKKEV